MEAPDRQSPRTRAPGETLLVGALSAAERDALCRLCPEANRWACAPSVAEGAAMLGARPYALVVLAQARPGQLPHDAPQRLRAVRPDAPLLSLAGAWCEGELRTGAPWDDVERVYWHQAPASLNDAEPYPPSKPLIEVATRSYDGASAWADALDCLGYPSVWSPRGGAAAVASGVRVAIWDGDQLDGREADALADFCQSRRRRATPVIAVFDFPRGDAVSAALDVGASQVLGRPWSLDGVSTALGAAQAGRGSSHSMASASPTIRAAAA